MVLFLLDEAVETGKGANTVISLLDFFLEDYGLKEVACHLHADNCSGQNKNNAMLHYLMWRFRWLTTPSSGPTGVLNFFKRGFRRTRVNCKADIVQVATAASSTGILTPLLCGDEAGNVLVPSRDWTAFLSEWFRELVGLRSSTISSSKPAGRSCAVKMWQVRSRSPVCSRDLLPCRTRSHNHSTIRPEPAEERISLSGDPGIRRSRLPGLGVPGASPPQSSSKAPAPLHPKLLPSPQPAPLPLLPPLGPQDDKNQ